MRLKEKIEESCEHCHAPELGIFYVNGGLSKACLSCGYDFGRLMPLPNNQFKMPFGRYVDVFISDLPTQYLQWGIDNLKNHSGIKKRFNTELIKRKTP